MIKALVVDDEAGMRQVISKVLAAHVDQIVQAEDGKTAIELARTEKPNLVMLDIRLPDMDGPEILASIKRINPDLPVIMLSGFGDVDTAVDLVQKGAYDYLSKPFKVDRLLEVVRGALGINAEKAQQPAAEAQSAAPVQNAPVTSKTAPAQPETKKRADIEIKTSWIIAAASILVFCIAGFFAIKLFNKGPAVAQFPLTYSNPSSICFDGENIWISDWIEETIYCHKRSDNLKVETLAKLTGLGISGITSVGNNLWSVSSLNSAVCKHKMDKELSVATKYDSPVQGVTTLFFDGEILWGIAFQAGKIYKLDLNNNLNVINSYESYAANPCGMFRKGNSYYIADASTNMVYKVKREDLTLEKVYKVPGFENSDNKISGITFDGKYIYVCADGMAKILRFKLSALKALGK